MMTVSEKCDVYSFGVLVLEVLIGKESIQPNSLQIYIPQLVQISASKMC